MTRIMVLSYGYSGFILLDKKKCPKYALHIENECRWAMKKYRKLYPDRPLPKITPHVYRHTFCTNMVNAVRNSSLKGSWTPEEVIALAKNIYLVEEDGRKRLSEIPGKTKQVLAEIGVDITLKP